MFGAVLYVCAVLLLCCAYFVQAELDSTSTTTTTTTAESARHDTQITIQPSSYVIGVLDAPLPLDLPVLTGSMSVDITSADGSLWTCMLPNPHAPMLPFGEVPTTTSTVSIQPENEAEKPAKTLEMVPGLVKTHLEGGCFRTTKGYWTYEVCPFRHVRQYHVEGNKQTETASIMLGTYDKESIEASTEQGIYIQKFTGGVDDRRVSLRFICPNPSDASIPASMQEIAGYIASKNADLQKALDKEKEARGEAHFSPADGSVLAWVEEPRQHLYLLTITTPLACNAVDQDPDRAARTAQDTSLESKLRNKCTQLNMGWWTYEFCYQRHVRQFHKENQPAKNKDDPKAFKEGKTLVVSVVTQEYSLGDPEDSQLEGQGWTTHTGKSWKDSYLYADYTGGTRCDENGQGRNTQVRLYCDPSETADFFIRNIDEIATCRYVMYVGSPFLCTEDLFAPEKPVVHEIVCAPKHRHQNSAAKKPHM